MQVTNFHHEQYSCQTAEDELFIHPTERREIYCVLPTEGTTTSNLYKWNTERNWSSSWNTISVKLKCSQWVEVKAWKEWKIQLNFGLYAVFLRTGLSVRLKLLMQISANLLLVLVQNHTFHSSYICSLSVFFFFSSTADWHEYENNFILRKILTNNMFRNTFCLIVFPTTTCRISALFHVY